MAHGAAVDAPDVVVRTDYLGLLDVGEGRLSPGEFEAHHLQVLEGPDRADAFLQLMVAAIAPAS